MLTVEDWRCLLCSALDSARADRDEQANLRRGLAALDKVLNTRASVRRAMYRQGLGWVDFEWGDEGAWPPTPSGERKGSKGIAHAIEARMRKDNLSHHQTVGVLRRMVRAIAQGEERKRFVVGKSSRVIVGKDGTEVHLVKLTGGNAWTMTVFDQR